MEFPAQPVADGAIFKKSSFCGDAGCVEVGVDRGIIAVRDSKVTSSPVLTFTPDEWRAFVLGVKHGEFDLQ